MKYGKQILLGVVASSAIAYGLSDNLRTFSKTFVLAGLGYGSIYYLLQNRKTNDKRVEELEELLGKKKVDERVTNLENMLQESDAVITEQEEVIKNYEELLDDASVKFPCNCGNNMFDGIFKPMEEFVVECDHCKNKYSVTLKLDTILITEPIEELNIDKLINANTNDKNRN